MMSTLIQEEESLFERLPDALLFTIFNKLEDAKSLCISMVVCKRFHFIVPQVDFISLSIPHPNPQPHPTKSKNQKGSFKNLITKILIKPFQFLLHIIKSRSSLSDDSFRYSLSEVLKPFRGIQKLDIILPSNGNIEIDSKNRSSKKTLLKWKGEFGKQLQSCVILGATSFSRIENSGILPLSRRDNTEQENGENDELPFTDDDLKRRIVWTITCLIAASARHYLLSEMLTEHEMVKHVNISDTSKQGRLCMNDKQIKELRGSFDSTLNKVGSSASLMEMRNVVPALKMKMWYAPEMEIPGSNWKMKGATLMVVRPAESVEDEVQSDGELVKGFFNGDDEENVVLDKAVSKLIKSGRNYTLEINSF